MKTVFCYVNYTPNDKSIGITKKIDSEISTLRKMGYLVDYCAYIDDGVAIFNNNDEIVKKIKWKFPKFSSKLRRFYLVYLCCQHLEKNKYDYCLLRWCAFDTLYLKMLENMKKNGSIVMMESLSYFPGMSYSNSSRGWYIDYFTEKNSAKAAKNIDLILSEGKFESIWGVPAIEFGMGVETEKITPHEYVGNQNEYHIITVANETKYHGYDRLIKSLDSYYSKGGIHKVHIHLVGVMFDSTIELAKKSAFYNYMHFYGKKSGIELDKIYEQCNIAAGPLGQHRCGGKRDTGLKTKEYFARGIPYFYCGQEDDALTNYPYIMQIPADESIVDYDKVVDFYERIKNENIVSSMREYAINEYSWEKKFVNVFNKLEEVVKGK